MNQNSYDAGQVSSNDFERFIECWNNGRFFDAHETLEPRWIKTRDRGLRGLIQLAAAFHHLQAANTKGARTLIKRAIPQLEEPLNGPCPIDQRKLANYARKVLILVDDMPPEAIVRRRPQLALVKN